MVLLVLQTRQLIVSKKEKKWSTEKSKIGYVVTVKTKIITYETWPLTKLFAGDGNKITTLPSIDLVFSEFTTKCALSLIPLFFNIEQIYSGRRVVRKNDRQLKADA